MVEWGYTGFTLSVCPSVRLETRFPELFEKNCWFNSFHTWHLPLWGESLVQPHFRPSGGQIFGWKWGFRNILKKLLAQFISYLAFTLMGWVSWTLYIFVFLASFSALWWPNIWPKMGSPELFEKTIGSIHFIPGIYPYGMSCLTPIHFCVPSLIFSPLVAKYLAENGVSRTFWNFFWLNSVFSWRIPTFVAHGCKIEIFIGYFWMRWVVIRAGVIIPIYGHSLFVFLFSCNQAALTALLSVCPSVLHTLLTMFLSPYHPEIFRS